MLSWQKLLEKLEKEELPTYLTHSPTENNCTINPLTNKRMTKLKRLLVLHCSVEFHRFKASTQKLNSFHAIQLLNSDSSRSYFHPEKYSI